MQREVRPWLARRAGRLIAGSTALSCLAFAIVLVTRPVQRPMERVPAEVKRVMPGPQGAAIPLPPSKVDPQPEARLDIPVRAAPAAGESPLNTEVRVFAALHRLGADLGEPIEVESGTDGRVLVGGVGVAPERKEEIRKALAAEPRVVIRFADSARASAPEESRRLTGNHGAFEAELINFAGDQASSERLSNLLLDESEEVLARAHALAILSVRFPAERQPELNDQARRALDEIREAHSSLFRQHAATLLRLLAPVSRALGAPAPAVVQSVNRLESAKRMDRVLSALLGGAHADGTPDRVLAELSNASAALEAALRSEK